MTEPVNTDNTRLLVTFLSISAPIIVSVFGYVLTNLYKNIKAVDESAQKRDADNTLAINAAENRAAAAIKDTETRATSYIHDVEARNIKRVEEAEARAEKGNERMLALLNSNLAEIRQELKAISKDVQQLTREGCGAAAAICGRKER